MLKYSINQKVLLIGVTFALLELQKGIKFR